MTKRLRSRRVDRLLACAALLLCGPASAHAACVAGDYVDQIEGLELVYRIPPTFNGTLVVYAAGYADSTRGGQYSQTPYFLGDAGSTQVLLDAGYLLAAVRYSLPDASACQVDGDYCQGRWSVPQGVTASAAVPARIAAVQPDCAIERRLVAGADMGGLVALQIAESPAHSAAFEGALAMCTPGMGLSRWVDGLIDYSIFRPAVGLPALPRVQAPNDVSWPYDWEADGVRSRLQNEVQSSSLFTRLEFQRLGADVSNPGNNLYYLPPNQGIFTLVQMATTLVADLQDQLGAPFGPLETLTGEATNYSLDPTDIAYLATTLGTPLDDLIAGLDAANATPAQLTASTAAREALYALGEVTGDLRLPALMLHGTFDPVTPEWSLTRYREAVSASARSARFLGVFADTGARHCQFGGAQLLTALNVLDAWAASGIAPTAAAFPDPDFDADHVPVEDPRRRVNVWLGDVAVTPGAGVQHVLASVVRSDTRSALTIAYAISGGHTDMGSLSFPAGGDSRAVIAVDVPDDRDQAVTLELVQLSGPANVIMPVRELLPSDGIFGDGFE